MSRSGGAWGLVAFAVFKTVATRRRRVGWVRFPHVPAIRTLLLACLVALVSQPVRAQQVDSARAGAPRAARVISPLARPPISPGMAFLNSVLVPGLGQAKLDRPTAGAFFVTAELISIALFRKAASGLREAQRSGTDSVTVTSWKTTNGREDLDSLGLPIPGVTSPNKWSAGGLTSARRVFREDWVAALLFNHLIAGIDAFVAAQLWDLPVQVSMRPTSSGGAALGLVIRTR